MILLRVGTDIITYKDDQFQIIPTLQDPITQSEFEEHGIEPDVFNSITEEEWALFKQDFNAQTFTVIVFTTYEDEPELVYNINSKALLGLDFLGVVTHQISLDFQASVWSSLLVDFENVQTANFPLHLAAQADDFKDFRVSFEPFVKEQGYIVLRVEDAYYSLKNNTVTFLSGFEGTVNDFKQYGMTPEDVAAIDAECWREFTVSHDAMNFKVVVFTTYADDPDLILDATELITFAAFDAILPTNVWKDNSFVIEVDSRTEPEGYPAQSVYYEIYEGDLGPENLLFSGMTPGSHIVENIEEDTVFILNAGAAGHIYFLVKREDENTLIVERSFPFEGAEWGLSETLKVDGDILLLKEKETSGEALSSHSQIMTLGRKTISGVTVLGSDDLTEEVLVGEPMASIGENLYEVKIPKGKQLIIEVVE